MEENGVKSMYDSFEVWLAKNKYSDLPKKEKSLLRKSLNLSIFLQFEDFNSRETFIAEMDPSWENPLVKSNTQRTSRKRVLKLEKKKEQPKELDKDRLGTLKSENKDYFSSENENIQEKKEIEINFSFQYHPALWIQISYSFLDRIKKDANDYSLTGIYQNYPLYLCVHTLKYQFEIDEIQKSLLHYKGRGVKIGIVDTGIDKTHPDLNGRVNSVVNLTQEDHGDYNGHGTFLASMISGSGKSSDRYYEGIAPESKLIDIKIFNEDGEATLGDLLLALDYLIHQSEKNSENKEELPDILLLGFTTLIFSTGQEIHPTLLESYLNLLNKKGTIIVSPIGNFGPDPGLIPEPNHSKNVISVGSIDENNDLAFFSSIPKIDSHKEIIFLPGTKIIAAKAYDSIIGNSIPGNKYIELSGTSISAAACAGFIAILKEAFPDASSKRIEELLYSEPYIPAKEKHGINIPRLFSILKKHDKIIKRPLPFKKMASNSSFASLSIILLIILLFFIFSGVM